MQKMLGEPGQIGFGEQRLSSTKHVGDRINIYCEMSGFILVFDSLQLLVAGHVCLAVAQTGWRHIVRDASVAETDFPSSKVTNGAPLR
ncbi:hypothetical protein VM1G_11911 [Cytospora mali]|uniref:Uncharacterized protein n=1 Tax=Cytospora mali TaxID=578113 RepID=A0A194WA34_CYTMA|nr:hypothetical protein VM1G_11911 [Valsa mali]